MFIDGQPPLTNQAPEERHVYRRPTPTNKPNSGGAACLSPGTRTPKPIEPRKGRLIPFVIIVGESQLSPINHFFRDPPKRYRSGTLHFPQGM